MYVCIAHFLSLSLRVYILCTLYFAAGSAGSMDIVSNQFWTGNRQVLPKPLTPSRSSSRNLHGPSRTAAKLKPDLPLHGTLHGTFTDLHGLAISEKARVK